MLSQILLLILSNFRVVAMTPVSRMDIPAITICMAQEISTSLGMDMVRIYENDYRIVYHNVNTILKF